MSKFHDNNYFYSLIFGQFVYHFFHRLCPLPWCFGVVESLPAYRLTDIKRKCIAPLLKYLIHQKKHLKIHFRPDHLPEFLKQVKKSRILPFEVEWYDIALILHRFLYKIFVPFQIDYFIPVFA